MVWLYSHGNVSMFGYELNRIYNRDEISESYFPNESQTYFTKKQICRFYWMIFRHLTPDVQRFDCGVSVCLSIHLLRPWSLQNDWTNTGAIWHYTRVGLRNNVQDWGVHIFTGIGLWVGGSGPFCCTVRSKEIITAAADCNAFRCHIIFSHTNLPSAVMWPVAGLFWAILSLLLALPS